MTDGAVRGEPGRGMARVVGVLEIRHMTSGAGPTGEVVVTVDVALSALHGGVESGQRKAGRRVVEGRIQPVRGAVAGLTGRGESSRSVRRIVGAVVVVLVAADASRIGASQTVIAVDVALLALQRGVEPG